MATGIVARLTYDPPRGGEAVQDVVLDINQTLRALERKHPGLTLRIMGFADEEDAERLNVIPFPIRGSEPVQPT